MELREETGVQRSVTERLARSRLHWAGHVERMADDRLPKRAAELCEQGRRRRGGQGQGRDGRDVRKAGEEKDWKKETRVRGGWMRRWTSCGQHLTPDKGGKMKREIWAYLSDVITSISPNVSQYNRLDVTIDRHEMKRCAIP